MQLPTLNQQACLKTLKKFYPRSLLQAAAELRVRGIERLKARGNALDNGLKSGEFRGSTINKNC
jgi:hypothetical protein